MAKYIFVTGGVVSGLGKGITAASLGRLLKSRGLKVTAQKLDPYINIDPGTMSPLQHGEVFVTEGGVETDLDLGHYKRFIDEEVNAGARDERSEIRRSIMRDYQQELAKRVEFIRRQLANAGANGIVYGNSGGKDSALVGILCRKACDNVLGVMMPCQSKRNFGEDMVDGLAVAEAFGIETVTVDLTAAKEALLAQVERVMPLADMAKANMNPRLRMITLYALAQSRNALVAGTGNRSETYMGYFTKWGDGACDFNPINDLTVKEVYEFLRFLQAPESIITKAPSAGLFEGQTDEQELGLTYAELDAYLLTGQGSAALIERAEAAHRRSAHKRTMPQVYQGE